MELLRPLFLIFYGCVESAESYFSYDSVFHIFHSVVYPSNLALSPD
jgi:hypothetical protein